MHTQNQLNLISSAIKLCDKRSLTFLRGQNSFTIVGEYMNVTVEHSSSSIEIWVKGTVDVTDMLFHKKVSGFPNNIGSNEKEVMFNHLLKAIKVAVSKYGDLKAVEELRAEVLAR
jgi:hypothetical protein